VATTSSGIAYDQAGDADHPTVVLVHAGVPDRRMWDPQWEALANDHHVVRLDLRGFGDSTVPPDGPLANVDDLLSVLAEIGVTRCHLVGASMGSGVVVEAALTAPDLARSLVLCPPGGSLFAEITDDLKAFWRAEGEALDNDDLDGAVEANVACWAVGPDRDPSEVDKGVQDAVRRMQRRAFEISLPWGELDEVELEPPALERLAEITVPTLVLVGGHDLGATRDSADRLGRDLADVRRVDWPDSAHLPSLEHPDRFLDLLLGWLAQHEG